MVNGIGEGYSGQMQMMELLRQQMSSASTDGTKGLSKEELGALSEDMQSNGKEQTPFLDKLMENFDTIDQNADGQLTKDEVDAAMKAHGSQKGGRGQGALGGRGGGSANLGDSSTSEDEVVFVQDGEDDSTITTDEKGNIVFRTVIKIGSGAYGSSESSPAMNQALLNPAS